MLFTLRLCSSITGLVGAGLDVQKSHEGGSEGRARSHRSGADDAAAGVPAGQRRQGGSRSAAAREGAAAQGGGDAQEAHRQRSVRLFPVSLCVIMMPVAASWD